VHLNMEQWNSKARSLLLLEFFITILKYFISMSTNNMYQFHITLHNKVGKSKLVLTWFPVAFSQTAVEIDKRSH